MNVPGFVIAKKVEYETHEDNPHIADVIIEPLERGWGYTLGNTFRRILLAYVPGAAVASVRIEGAAHEFSTLEGVKEDVSEIILNVKQLSVRLLSDEDAMLHLEASGEGEVKASDIEETNKVEIVNPDLHIATINSDANLKMSMRVTAGRGYVPAERNKIEDDPEGTIAIDSVFSPIKRVNYEVENTRVGQRTDLDRLILRVETDGSMTVKEAIQKAAAMLYTHIQVFLGEEKQADVQMVSHSDEDTSKLREILEKGVDELELPSRAHNCLKSANIHTLGDLVRNTESEMLKYKNFGKKSLDELKEILQGYGIDFGMDVDAIIGEKKETT